MPPIGQLESAVELVANEYKERLERIGDRIHLIKKTNERKTVNYVIRR